MWPISFTSFVDGSVACFFERLEEWGRDEVGDDYVTVEIEFGFEGELFWVARFAHGEDLMSSERQ